MRNQTPEISQESIERFRSRIHNIIDSYLYLIYHRTKVGYHSFNTRMNRFDLLFIIVNSQLFLREKSTENLIHSKLIKRPNFQQFCCMNSEQLTAVQDRQKPKIAEKNSLIRVDKNENNITIVIFPIFVSVCVIYYLFFHINNYAK